MYNTNKIPNISIIVAIARNNAIGKDNSLLWHISDDLKRFKTLTSGHPIIMGRNTWESLPKKPLPKRRNIILTHDHSFSDQGVEVAYSIQGVLDLIVDEEESFVIGGANVYRQFLPLAKRIYATWVWQDFDADAYFPVIDFSVFSKISETEHKLDNESGLYFSYAEYSRRPADRKIPFVEV